MELLAVLAGTAVNAVSRNKASRGPGHADQLAAALELDMAAHWKPLAEGFFARLTKAQLATQLVEVEHVDVAERLAALKKVEAAELAATTLGQGWLPQPLRA